MEKNSYIDYQSSNLDWGAQPSIRQPNLFPAHMNLYYEFSSNGLFPSSAFTDLPLPILGQQYEANSNLYGLPHSHHAFGPVLSENLPTETFKKVEGHGDLPISTGCSQKQFLVFDQSGKQTTMLYRFGIDTPDHFMNSGYQNQVAFNWHKKDPAINGDAVSHLEPALVGELDENRNDGNGSDTHEDTEELNALLYSDDDTEDDEETSTGHSPSDMAIPGVEVCFKSKWGKVSSSAGSTKRQKLLDGGYDSILAVTDTALKDTACSMKCIACPDTEDCTESSCGNHVSHVPTDFSFFSGNKRSSKENIRRTLEILQKVIPDVKGKDTMDIIDEAIHYLQSLKSIAKDVGLVAF